MSGLRTERLRADLALWRLELRRNIGLLAFLPLVGLTLWITNGELPERIWLWNETARALQASVILLAPLVAGLAAWAAGRDRRHGTSELLSTMPASHARQGLLACAGTLTWGAFTFLAAVAIMGGLTAWYATWATPVPGPILIGLTVTLMYGAIGFAAGYWVLSRFTAPIVAIVLFAAQVIVADWASYDVQQFSPYRLGYRFPDDVFYEVHPSLTLPYAIWALGVMGIAIVFILLRSQRTTPVWAGLVLASIVTVGGGSALVTASDSEPERVAIPYEPVCDESGITVCVHPAYEPLLLDAADVIRNIIEPVEGFPGVPHRANQRSMSHPGYGDSKRKPDELSFELVNMAYHENGTLTLARDVAWRLVGAPDDPMNARAQAVVADWLIYRAGHRLRDDSGSGNYIVWGWTEPFEESDERQALDRFINMPNHERAEWFEANWAELRAGELQLKDLP